MNDKTNPIEIVEELNQFFANIGPELDWNIGDSALNLNYENKINIPLLYLQETDQEEVKKLLLSILDCKATGDNGIPIRFLKTAIDITSNIIAYVVQHLSTYGQRFVIIIHIDVCLI